MIERIGQPDLQANMQRTLPQATRQDDERAVATAVSKSGETEKNQALDWKPCAT
jgi:hypothetical protein